MSVSKSAGGPNGGTDNALKASVDASLQHLELLGNRIAKLIDAQDQAERQVLHRVGCAYRDGDMTITDLIGFFQRYRAIASPKKMQRWNESVNITYQSMLMQLPPNGPAHTWIGDWPHTEGAPYPLSGICVVYVLYGDDNEPCYVGSTRKFRSRMNQHAKGGKRFARWQAYPCPDRERAYVLEERLLKEYKPRLNRRTGR